MALSGTTNFTETRDTILTRALRIVDGIAQGETPTATQLADATQVLQDLIKRFQADGMQIWRRSTVNFTPVAGTGTYSIGTGSTLNQPAPLKVYDAWYRNNTSNTDQPMLIITREEFDKYNNKSNQGSPNLMYYDPPGSLATAAQMIGTIYLLPVPAAAFASNNKIYITAQYPIQDMTASGDNPDFPSYYYNALVWAVASNISYEYGVPLAERSMIDKKALEERLIAMSFDTEEGSVYLQPDWIG